MKRLRDADDAARVLDETQPILMRYRWPDNVHELQNVIERIAVEMAEGVGDGSDRSACGVLEAGAL